MEYFQKIVGERVYLSPLTSDDANMFAKWLNDYEVAKGIDVMALQNTITNQREWLEKRCDDYLFGIVLKENNRLIGSCQLMNLSSSNRTASVEVFIGEADQRGKGYGKEGLNLLLDYAFNHLNLNNVMLIVFAYNKKAINMYGKLGFKRFGQRRSAVYHNGQYYDAIYMDILKDEYNSTKDFIFIP